MPTNFDVAIKNSIPPNFALRIRFLDLHSQNKDDSIKKFVQDLIQHEESQDPASTSPPSFSTDGWDLSSSSRDSTKPIHFIVEHEYVIGHPESIFDVVMSGADYRGNYVFKETVTDKNGVVRETPIRTHEWRESVDVDWKFGIWDGQFEERALNHELLSSCTEC
ncbi:hypothetical protein C8R41DRAFT_921423 [Lentinula lateritia]|uniref:Uncharacterized protein n=1 Tax=Lentinula lateritia TaxID=40482 RepID=A0ABQ8VBZ5_9AGAR|nr:hypothetical protein C8R41DRAFT_921423 [Lentinula lateritia]